MSDDDFDFLRTALRERAGIVLEADKRYLVENRLAPLLPELGLASVAEFAARARREPHGAWRDALVERLVTTESLFFRDPPLWEELRGVVLPDLLRRREGERRLEIWCGAAASGQEPYSLAMLLRDRFPQLAGWQVRIVATDISSAMLHRCREGLYSQLEVNRGLPATALVKHFAQEGLSWRIAPELRRAVEFRALNLCGPWPALPPLDLVLLRNVMIYFAPDDKKAILGRIARLLRPGGWLALGAAETTLNLDASFQREPGLKSGLFRLTGTAA